MTPFPEALSAPEKTAIDNSISKMPVQATADEDAASAAIIGAGKPGIFYLVQKLVPSGTGDDTGARFALGSVVRYVSRAGAAGEKADFVNAILAGIEYHKDVEVKSFLMSQLHLVGGNECVGPLAAYLADPALCEPATQALLAIRTPNAEGALLQALPAAIGKNRLTLLRALGDLRSRAAAPAITRFVGSTEPDVNMAALWALANIGDYSSAPVLQNAAMNSTGLQQKELESYNLLYASRIVDDARTASESVNQAFLKKGIEDYTEGTLFEFHPEYHFGGYAKSNTELLTFIKDFSASTGILIDPVYTGKMFYSIFDLISKDHFTPGSKILAIHTGGIAGILGMADRFNF